jgi:hypothetical protein
MWTKQESGTTAKLLCAAWLDSTIYVTGDSGILLSSKNGIEWGRNCIDSTGAFYCIIFTGTQFIAGGVDGTSGIIYTSHKEGVTETTTKPLRPIENIIRPKQGWHIRVPLPGYNGSHFHSESLLLSGRRINGFAKNSAAAAKGPYNIYITRRR